MKKVISISFLLLASFCMCQKNDGIEYLIKTEINNGNDLKIQIGRTITYICNNKPNDLLELFNEKISLGGDMIIDLADLKTDFKLHGDRYATIFNSHIYYNKYIKTGQIRHSISCQETQMSIQEALSLGLKNGLVIEIYNQNGNKDAAYVSVNWQPVKCEERLSCVLNYSLINNKWKLTNADWRQNF
jgi:hypothetical protein